MKPVILMLLLAVPLSAYQAQSSRNKNKSPDDTSQGTSQTDHEDAVTPPATINNSVNTPPSEKPDQTTANAPAPDPNNWIEYVNAWSTLIIAVFTAFLFGGIVVQIRTSRAIERAWVMAEIQPDPEKPSKERLQVFEGSGASGDSTAAMNAVLSCSNAGKTPAWIEETIAKFEMVKSLPQTPNFKSAQSIHRSTIPLGMAEGGAVPHAQKIQWTPIAEGHQHTDEMAVIYGQVTYRDIFRKKHRTTFGYKIRPHGRLERLEGYPEYNKGT
jgi:hypothetical protein